MVLRHDAGHDALNAARYDVIESIEVAIVELRGVAQPHEIAHFRELVLDARDAATSAQLTSIAAEVEGLKTFCAKREMSSSSLSAVTALDGKPRR